MYTPLLGANSKSDSWPVPSHPCAPGLWYWKLEYILTIPKALMSDVKADLCHRPFINHTFLAICFSVFNSDTFVKNRMDLYYQRNLVSYVLQAGADHI